MKKKNVAVVASVLVISMAAGFFAFNRTETTVKKIVPQAVVENDMTVEKKAQGITSIKLKYDDIKEMKINKGELYISLSYEDKDLYYSVNNNMGTIIDIEKDVFDKVPSTSKTGEESINIETIVTSKDGNRTAEYDESLNAIVVKNISSGSSTQIKEGFDEGTIKDLSNKVKFAYHGGYVSIESAEGISIVGTDSGKVYLDKTYGGRSTRWADEDLRLAYVYLVDNARNRVGFYNVKTKRYKFSPKLSTYYIDQIVDWIDSNNILLIGEDKNTGNKEVFTYDIKNNIYKFDNESKGYTSFDYQGKEMKMVFEKDGKYSVVYYDFLDDHRTAYNNLSPIYISENGDREKVLIKRLPQGAVLFTELDTMYLEQNDIRTVVTYDVKNTEIEIIDDKYIIFTDDKNNITIYELTQSI